MDTQLILTMEIEKTDKFAEVGGLVVVVNQITIDIN